MKLTKPLPTASSQTGVSRPWLLKLADGSICEIETGTIAQVGGQDVPYGCSDSRQCDDNGNCPFLTGLGDSLKTGKLWTAEKFSYSADGGGIKLLKRKRVAVLTVWK